MNNEEKIIKLLEEIRNAQITNFNQAVQMQSKVVKKMFWPIVVAILLISLILLLLTK